MTRWGLVLALAAALLAGCARVKVNVAGSYANPLGGWTANPAAGVKQYGGSPGGEVGVGFGDQSFCDVRLRYLDLNLKPWERYAAEHGDTITARARILSATVAAEIGFPLGRFVPLLNVGAGYFFPSGAETYERYGITYPYSFFRQLPGALVGLGVAWYVTDALAVIPRCQYVAFPGIRAAGGPTMTWVTTLEPGLGISYLVTKPAEKELQRQVAAKLKEKEARMSSSYFNQGVSYYDLGEFDAADNAFDLALIWDPASANAAEWLAKTVRSRKSARIETALADARTNLNAGNLPEAVRLYNEVLALDSANLIARSGRQQAETRLAAPRSAAVESHFASALAAYESGRYLAARSEWQRILATDSANAEARRYLALTTARIGALVTDGLAEARRLLKIEKWARAARAAARVLRLDAANVEAQEIRRVAQVRLEEARDRLLARGIDGYDKGHYVEAEGLMRAALAIDPGNSVASGYLTKIESQRRRVNREDLSSYYLRGIEAYTQEDFDGAIFYWQKVLEIDPGHRSARKNIERARAKLAALEGE